MTDLEKIILYTLSAFKVAIAINIGDKLVVLNPRILKTVDLAEIATALSASDLSDEEILQGLELIDEARNTRVPSTD